MTANYLEIHELDRRAVELSAQIVRQAKLADLPRPISFHFIDYVAHGWDVARSLGIPFRLDDELAGAALSAARRVPDGPERLIPGAAFRPGVPAAGASAIDQVLAALGRSPDWSA